VGVLIYRIKKSGMSGMEYDIECISKKPDIINPNANMNIAINAAKKQATALLGRPEIRFIINIKNPIGGKIDSMTINLFGLSSGLLCKGDILLCISL
jgi:hypothetical protein